MNYQDRVKTGTDLNSEPRPLPAVPKMAASSEDAFLLQQLRAGDETAFLKLVERHHNTLLRLARVYVRSPEVAEEVVQETWLGVLKGIDRFEGRSSLKTWIFRILTNRAKTRGEREARSIPFSALAQGDAESGDSGFDLDRFLPTDHPQWPGHWALPPAAWEGNPEERLLAEERKKCILDLIDSLPEGQRAVITLRDLQGLTAAEVCNVLEISETNQRVLLHRARTKVRTLCEELLTKG